MVVVRHAVWMSGNLGIKGKYFTFWQNLAQMVIGPSVAQSKFKHRAGNSCDQVCDITQANALGGKAANDTVEAAHEESSSWRFVIIRASLH